MDDFEKTLQEVRIEYTKTINALNNQLDNHITNEIKLLEKIKQLREAINDTKELIDKFMAESRKPAINLGDLQLIKDRLVGDLDE